MKVGVVEPHFDDFWLNLGGFFLKHPEFEFSILSVSFDHIYNNINHTADLVNYFDNIKTKHLSYLSLDVNEQKNRQEMQKVGCDSYEELFLFNNHMDNLHKLTEQINLAMYDNDVIFMPAGMHHPMHAIISNLDVAGEVYKYREFPYAFYPHCAKQLKKISDENVSVTVDITSVLQKKMDIFKNVYTSQEYILQLDDCPIHLDKLIDEVYFIPHGKS